jgi:hypothetical protein
MKKEISSLMDDCNSFIREFKNNKSGTKEQRIKYEAIKKLKLFLQNEENQLIQAQNEEKVQEIEDLSIMGNNLVNSASLQALNKKLEETLPDFFPVTQSVIEGCSVQISNYGSLIIEDGTFFNGGVQLFSLNSDPLEILAVPKNCKGTLNINSFWHYWQELENPIYANQKKEDINSSFIGTFKMSYPFRVDEKGSIQIFKGSYVSDFTTKVPAKLLFKVDELEQKIINNNSLTFSGRIYINEDGLTSDKINDLKKLFNRITLQDTITKEKGALSSAYTVSLELVKTPKISSKVDELIFEKENQAILSSDQTKHLQLWWKMLNPKLKERIENQEALIIVEGFTSHTGGHDYNLKLGKDRAKDVRKKLHSIIGDINGEEIAKIKIGTFGEIEESRRYVRIKVK